MTFRERFGVVIRRRRKAMKMSQARFGFTHNVDFNYLGEIERGKANWTILIADRIANGLGVSIYTLFDESKPDNFKRRTHARTNKRPD